MRKGVEEIEYEPQTQELQHNKKRSKKRSQVTQPKSQASAISIPNSVSQDRTEKKSLIYQLKEHFSRKKTCFVCAIFIQSVFMAIEQCIAIVQFNRKNGQADLLTSYIKVVGHHTTFCLVFNFLIVFLLKDVSWGKGELIPMLKFYLIVGFATLAYPLVTTSLSLQAMSCFSVVVLLIQICVVLVFPAPLIHSLLGVYFAIGHTFYRLHWFTYTASDEQKLQQMNAAEQLFQIIKSIGLLSIIVIYKNDDVKQVEKHEVELKEVLEIQEDNPMILQELHLDFSDEFPTSNSKFVRKRDVSCQTDATKMQFPVDDNRKPDQFSMIGGPLGATILLDNEESEEELRDLHGILGLKKDPRFNDYKSIVQNSKTPIFVLDTNVLSEQISWAGRQKEFTKSWPTGALRNLVLYQNTQTDNLSTDFELQPIQMHSIASFECLTSLEEVSHHQRTLKEGKLRSRSLKSLVEIFATLLQEQLCHESPQVIYLVFNHAPQPVKYFECQFYLGKTQKYLVVVLYPLQVNITQESATLPILPPIGAESLLKLCKVINQSALLEQKLSQQMGKDSFTNPLLKGKAMAKPISFSSVIFEIFRNLSIDIWSQTKVFELEMLSRVAYSKIQSQKDIKLRYSKLKTSLQQQFEVFLLPFQKQLAEKKIIIKFVDSFNDLQFAQAHCDWSVYFSIIFQVITLLQKQLCQNSTINVSILLLNNSQIQGGNQLQTVFFDERVSEQIESDQHSFIQLVKGWYQNNPFELQLARQLARSLEGELKISQTGEIWLKLAYTTFEVKREINIPQGRSREEDIQLQPNFLRRGNASESVPLQEVEVLAVQSIQQPNLFSASPPSRVQQNSLRFENLIDLSNGSGKEINSDSLSLNIPNEPQVPMQVSVRVVRSDEVKIGEDSDQDNILPSIFSKAPIQRKASCLQLMKGKANFTEMEKRNFISEIYDRKPSLDSVKSPQFSNRVIQLNQISSIGSFVCKCSEVMIVGEDSFANFPVIQVLKSLFSIKFVDQVFDKNQVISLFTDRVQKKCCVKRYKLVICDSESVEINSIAKTLKALTQVRVKEAKLRKNSSFASLSESYNQSSVSQFDEMNMSQFVQRIQTRSRDCAFVCLVNASRVQKKNLNLSLIQHVNKPYLDMEAINFGFTEIVPKPLTLEVLTRLIETYLGNGNEDSD